MRTPAQGAPAGPPSGRLAVRGLGQEWFSAGAARRLSRLASPPHALATVCSCDGKGCACRGFFYIVAEGAWILRCRCKHKVRRQLRKRGKGADLSAAVLSPLHASWLPSTLLYSVLVYSTPLPQFLGLQHIDHSLATHACAKRGCGCSAFDSPWVCNCDVSGPASGRRQLGWLELHARSSGPFSWLATSPVSLPHLPPCPLWRPIPSSALAAAPLG